VKTLDFWFDPVSPYAWLAFDALPQALSGFHVSVRYQPVLLAGLLAHWGHKGPAEIPPKRVWTYRDVAWRAHQQALPLDLPRVHPFNPLALLRLAVACAPPGGTPSRYVTERIFRHVWVGGDDAASPERLATLTHEVEPLRDPADPAVKAELLAQTDLAVAAGVFGVPALVVDGVVFWGTDALPMLAAWLAGDVWFQGPSWADAARPRVAMQRNAGRS
jgi:2-hydroxychromene-2-carboxylate isomerase